MMKNKKNKTQKKKLISFLLFATIASNSFALFLQKIPPINVTIIAENTKLKNVFSSIESQTDCSFAYNESIGNDKISLINKNKPLKQVLNDLSKEKGLSFKSIGNSITVKRLNKDIQQQEIRVRGIVIDKNDKSPLPYATIVEKNTNNNTASNTDGKFSLKVSNKNSKLLISYVGYTTREITINANSLFLTIELEPLDSQLNEIVLVGYTSKKKKEVTGAISTISNKAITQSPVGNITTTLAGRASGLLSIQPGGQPGFDNANIRIRDFGNPLVIIDGVEGNFSTLDPNTVESFSILKDASASIYGARAGNGVILINTKRGKNKRPKFTINSSYTLQSLTMMPKPVNAGQYAELLVEAHKNSGGDEDKAPFSEEEIQKYYDGSDPQYPNTNWYDEIFRDYAPQLNHNISVRGGSEKVKYYAFFGYLNQETMVRKGNSGYSRYNLISNADLKINEYFKFSINISNVLDSKKYPSRGLGANNYRAWQDYWNTIPTYPSTLPDPTKLSYAEGSNTGGAHITMNRDVAGYRNTDKENLNTTLNLKYKNDLGIFGAAFFNYNKVYTTVKNFERPVKFYTYNYESNSYNLEGALGSNASLNINEYKYRKLNGQLSIGYDGYFKDDHHIRILSLFEVTDYNNNFLKAGRNNFISESIEELYGGSTQNMTNDGYSNFSGRKSFVNRLSYDYKKKYFIDFILRSDASSRFPKEGRWGYFPGISIGWRVSKESFMNSFDNLNELKLRLSYGEAGNDDVGNLMYKSGYKISDNRYDGISYLIGDKSYKGVVSLGLANPNLTWERTKIYNGGVDFSFYNRKLYGEIDAFYRERSGIIGTKATSIPSSVGADLPPENINSITNRGFELTLGTSGDYNELNWDINANLSWSRAKWKYFDEPNYEDDDLRRINKKTGEWVDRVFGYKSDGLFRSQEEIDKLDFNQDNNQKEPNSSLAPGDVKYVDVNKDGVLDWRDKVNLGSTTPHWLVGLNINLSYKSFDFNTLFQGAFDYNSSVSLRRGSVFTQTFYEERWSPDNNKKNAIIPRLGGSGVKPSDFNIKRADYLRIKNMTLGYTLPTANTFDRVRIYISGTNLFTFSELNKYDIDPETLNGGGLNYPQQKTYSLGLNLSF